VRAVPESEQVHGFWRDYCAAVLAWPEVPAMPADVRKHQRNPLRCVVSRQIIRQRISWGTTILLYHEVLSCGHPYTFSPILEADYIAHRRRCAACGEPQVRRATPALPTSRSPQVAMDAPRRAPIHLPPPRRAA
jgi:hypothetical protein